MGNEQSAKNSDFCRDSGVCCGRSGTSRSNKLIDIFAVQQVNPHEETTARISPSVEFDRSAWLQEHQEPNNKPQDEGPDRLGALKAARADRRRAHAVLVHPVAALTLRQFTQSPWLSVYFTWRSNLGELVQADRQFRQASVQVKNYEKFICISKISCWYFPEKMQEIGVKRSSTKPDGSPSRMVENFLKKKNSLTTEHNKTRLQSLERWDSQRKTYLPSVHAIIHMTSTLTTRARSSLSTGCSTTLSSDMSWQNVFTLTFHPNYCISTANYLFLQLLGARNRDCSE